MATLSVTVNGTALPGEIIKVDPAFEMLWSEGTGRSASPGAMAGTIVCRKLTYQIDWAPVTQAQLDSIHSICDSGTFMPIVIKIDGVTIASFTGYRSTITASLVGVFGGTPWYRDVNVQFVEA